MQCSILCVISIVLSLVSSGLKAFLSAIFKGATIYHVGGGAAGNSEKKNDPTWKVGKMIDFVSAMTTSKNSALLIPSWGVKQKPCLERIFHPPPKD